jgi:putative glutamine amidotransferase
VNVGLGGSLYVDIPSQYPNALRHQCSPDYPRDYLAHQVKVSEGSRLERILGENPVWVNSLHHQAVRQMAPGLQTAALSPDGLVEAVELPDHPFGLAVQWHPECLTAHPPMRALFAAFVRAAAKKDK